MSDLFWIDNPSIIWQPNRALEFVPKADQNQNARLNAITRFMIYLAVILAFYLGDLSYLSLIVVGLLGTYLIYVNSSSHLTDEAFNEVVHDPEITVDSQQGRLC